MGNVNIIFNQNKIISDDNLTILEFAKSQGIEIPTLCFDKRLDPYGSCFVCVVDVKGAKTLVPACATKLREGIEIETNSNKVLDSRKTAIELLLSNHYGDCIAPCKSACPANCDVQGYVGLIANKKYKDAIKLIKETIPMPATIGRVCPKFCEEKCRRQFVDESIAIDHLKRFVADKDLFSDNPYTPILKNKINKKVAIIGGGPAGLSASYYLIQEGVDVEIFEQKDKLGGMLLYGIPQYRLPKDILQKEIDLIIRLGIKVNYNKTFGKDFTIESLKKDGFDAIIIAIGAWSAMKLGIPNEDCENVLDGIKFLEQVAENRNPEIYGKVAVVGGGNSAFDCARTALRLGASEVEIIYRRTKEEMPANEIEKEEAEEEGINFLYLTAPVEVIKQSNKAIGLICQKMRLGEPDSSGRKSPIPVEGSNFEKKYDFIIAAIGQRPDFKIQDPIFLNLIKDGKKLLYNTETMQTDIPYIFAIGDFATGAATVVEALAGGKKAALSIVKYLNNEKIINTKEFLSKREDLKKLDEEFYSKWNKEPRNKIEILSPEIRKTNFNEIEKVFTEDNAIKEASRCMECGCMDVYECLLKKYAQDYNCNGVKYKGEIKIYKNDINSKYILREPSKCILCGRCVRLCSERVNLGIYGYVKRGFDSIIQPEFQKELIQTDCIQCGTCISGCPVGAINAKTFKEKNVPLKGIITESNCYHCSIGCENFIETIGNSIYEVKEKGYLCQRGRFNIPEIIHNNNRNYDILKNFENADIYPSASLSIEDYESIKAVSKIMNWNIINYYSQSSLWQAFAEIGKLPSMNFFTEDIKENSLVIIAGNIEITNPVALNKFSLIKKSDTQIYLINKQYTPRIKNYNGLLFKNIEEIKNSDLNKFSEVILLINPVDFDNNYGNNSSLLLYNYLINLKINLRTTLFSNLRNIYSFYDANLISNSQNEKALFIGTIFEKEFNYKNIVILDYFKQRDDTIYIPYSFQTEGSYLSSRNKIYKNNKILNNNEKSLSEILKEVFNLENINIKNIENINQEINLLNEKNKLNIKFPKDSFLEKYF